MTDGPEVDVEFGCVVGRVAVAGAGGHDDDHGRGVRGHVLEAQLVAGHDRAADAVLRGLRLRQQRTWSLLTSKSHAAENASLNNGLTHLHGKLLSVASTELTGAHCASCMLALRLSSGRFAPGPRAEPQRDELTTLAWMFRAISCAVPVCEAYKITASGAAAAAAFFAFASAAEALRCALQGRSFRREDVMGQCSSTVLAISASTNAIHPRALTHDAGIGCTFGPRERMVSCSSTVIPRATMSSELRLDWTN